MSSDSKFEGKEVGKWLTVVGAPAVVAATAMMTAEQ